jgi:hypothetical protein
MQQKIAKQIPGNVATRRGRYALTTLAQRPEQSALEPDSYEGALLFEITPAAQQ